MVSIIKSTLVNADYTTPTTVNLKAENGDRIKVHGKITTIITTAIHCLRRNYINDNILILDFFTDKDVDINCRNIIVTDNVTKFNSTGNNLPAPQSHSPVLAVSLDLSRTPDTSFRKKTEHQLSIFGDTDFITQCTQNTTHRIVVSTQPNFCTARKLCPEKLSVAKSSFDKMQCSGIIQPSKSPYASPLHMIPKKTPETVRRLPRPQPNHSSRFVPTATTFIVRTPRQTCFQPIRLSQSLSPKSNAHI